LLCEWRLRPV